MPKLSLCIPVLNGGKYLQECIESALAQTIKDYEIIIVDDGSSDASVEIIEKYQKQSSIIKLYKNRKRLGLVGNWNHCIELSEGIWIKYLFQDDVLLPTCCEQMVDVGSSEHKPIVSCKRSYVFENDVSEAVRQFYLGHSGLDSYFSTIGISPDSLCNAVIENVGNNLIGEPSVVCFKKSIISQFGVFNPYLVSICDWEYWLRIAVNTGIAFLGEQLANFRVHGTSTSANYNQYTYPRDVLDWAVFWHEIAYNPYYSRLRKAARTKFPPLFFRRGATQLALHAHILARQQSKPPTIDKRPLTDYGRIANVYPRIKRPPMTGLLYIKFLSWKSCIRHFVKRRR